MESQLVQEIKQNIINTVITMLHAGISYVMCSSEFENSCFEILSKVIMSSTVSIHSKMHFPS